MIAVLICVFSLAALGQVFVSYCRALLDSARRVELSARALQMAGLEGERLAAEDYGRFLQLVRLCPEHGADQAGVGAITTYFRLLEALDRVLGTLVPALSAWTAQEEQGCAHFAAVVLDRCISSNRSLFARQPSDHP